jgi:hypothetical protein
LERCTVATLAEAHKVINKAKAKTDRIVLSPFSLPTDPLPGADHRVRVIMVPTSAAISAVSVELILCVRATTAAGYGAFTIDQIG